MIKHLQKLKIDFTDFAVDIDKILAIFQKQVSENQI